VGIVSSALVSALSVPVLLSSAAQASDTMGGGASLLRASEAAMAHEHSVHVVSFNRAPA
jgi:hypothetical protein